MRGLTGRVWEGFRRARVVSPRGFLVVAALPPLLLGVLELAGARGFTGVLCLTVPPGWTLEGAALVGGAYLVAWFLTVAVSPALVVGAGVFAVLGRALPSPP